jgi:uncharacterized protein
MRPKLGAPAGRHPNGASPGANTAHPRVRTAAGERPGEEEGTVRVGATYVEIPVVDMRRAATFYGYVFGVALETTTIDGVESALFPEVAAGANVALAGGESYAPSLDGTRAYLAVDDIAAVLARVVERGGGVLYPRTDIGDLGFVAEFSDSEGNRIALSEPTRRGMLEG